MEAPTRLWYVMHIPYMKVEFQGLIKAIYRVDFKMAGSIRGYVRRFWQVSLSHSQPPEYYTYIRRGTFLKGKGDGKTVDPLTR